jgi:Ca2+/Na+ antiporter
MKIEMKDFAFLVVGLIISHYVEQRMPTVTILGFTFFSGWLFLVFFLLYVLWMYSRKRLKKQIKDEILKELGLKG